MNKQEFISNLREKSQELAELSDKIAKAPSMEVKGHLVSRISHGKLRLYEKEGDADRYLRSEEEGRIKLLASKTYADKLDKAARLEKSQVDLCIEILESRKNKAGIDHADTDLVFGQLPEYIRQHTAPDEITDDGYAQVWQSNKNYSRRWSKDGDTPFETPRGDKVRSKSEWMIASMLTEAGVPYRYEALLALSPVFKVFRYPDFTVLNKRTRKEYYWEHFGLMGDSDYIENTFLPKISDYYNFGFLPGDKLLMTFESKIRPLNTTDVKRVIETYLI